MATTELPANPYLAGNYGPVPDEITAPAEQLEVRGRIPEALRGRYLRTGPNPIGAPPNPYHWFIGDGMIHGIELRDGQATWYRNRWVRTSGASAALGDAPVAGPGQPMYDSSNTNVLGFAGKVLSFTEGCYPYELSRELDTLRRHDFGGVLPHGMTAHPKVDPITGELHGFSYWWDSPFLIYHVVDATGQLTKTVPIELPRAVSMHDFALTRTHVLFFDQPYVFDLEMAMKSGFPFRWAPEFGSRVGVLPRDAESGSEIVWIETETCYSFHPMNAYDDGSGRIVADIPKMTSIGDGNAPEPDRLMLERWTLDVAARRATQDLVDPAGQEFCRINEALLGSRHRYGYTLASFGSGPYGGTTIYKRDYEAGTRTDHDFGAGSHPGEFVFVADPDRTAREDGGWVMGLVHDDATDRTSLVILDAQDFAGPEVARVTVPRRIPYGFHGNWVTD